MAIFHLTAKVFRRSQGQNAVAAAAYRAAEVIKDQSIERSFYFDKRKGVVAKEILAPEGVPDWVFDRTKLWNKVESIERRKDAQLAREVEVAIPKELSNEESVDLVRQYVMEEFVSKGMVADVCFHRHDDDKPHAHIMLTLREIGPDGFGKKVRDWNDRSNIWRWREAWARAANHHLARAGHEVRISHKSYKDMGINLEPQPKLGVSSREATPEYQRIIAERQQLFLDVAKNNGERILEDPSIVGKAISVNRSTFTQNDIARFVATHTIDSDQFRLAYEKALASDEIVRISTEKGSLYTTREMVDVEQKLVNTVEKLRLGSHKVDQKLVLDAIVAREKSGKPFSADQRNALVDITMGSRDIAVVEGFAGAGKSYMLDAAREVWERQGYHVKGAALAGIAAEGLQLSAHIDSRSLHSWEYRWKSKKDAPTSKDVFVIDEAGMVGSRQLQRILGRLQRAGAKVVLVGDSEQLQAIEAGAPMRAIADKVGKSIVGEIRRQKQDWQKETTMKLATGKTKEAISTYQNSGFVHEHQSQDQAIDAVIADWNEHRQSKPKELQILLAYRRDEVDKLNTRARELMRRSGLLGKQKSVLTDRGERLFAKGDRVYFLKNDSLLGVKNGTLGTVERIGKVGLQVRLDNGARLVVDTNAYKHFDHGYAATVHKSQGVTVDRAHVLASTLFDRHVAYVALSRHEHQVDLHWSTEEFGKKETFFETLSQKRQKDLVLDYVEVAQLVGRESKLSKAKTELDKKFVSLQMIKQEISKLSRSKNEIKFQLAREIEKEHKFCSRWKGKWLGSPTLKARLDLSEVRLQKFYDKNYLMREFLQRIGDQKQKRNELVKQHDSLKRKILLERAKMALHEVPAVERSGKASKRGEAKKVGKEFSPKEQGLVDDIVHAYYRSAGDEGQLVAKLFVVLMRETESFSRKSGVLVARKHSWEQAQKLLVPSTREDRYALERFEKLEKLFDDTPKTFDEARDMFFARLKEKSAEVHRLADAVNDDPKNASKREKFRSADNELKRYQDHAFVQEEVYKFWQKQQKSLARTKSKLEELRPGAEVTLARERERFDKLRIAARLLYDRVKFESERKLVGEKAMYQEVPEMRLVMDGRGRAEKALQKAQRQMENPRLTGRQKRLITRELREAEKNYELACVEFDQVYGRQDVKDRIQVLANRCNEEILKAKEVVKEIKPDFQKALEVGKEHVRDSKVLSNTKEPSHEI